eukprot:scaffold4598_cov229-Pinguiococcus_pyrenoidosus.AAC.3
MDLRREMREFYGGSTTERRLQASTYLRDRCRAVQSCAPSCGSRLRPKKPRELHCTCEARFWRERVGTKQHGLETGPIADKIVFLYGEDSLELVQEVVREMARYTRCEKQRRSF